jgi:hypothetical protein
MGVGKSKNGFTLDDVKNLLQLAECATPQIQNLITNIEQFDINPSWINHLHIQLSYYVGFLNKIETCSFILESLLYVLQHPEVIKPIQEYTFGLFQMNRYLDDYCNPESRFYLNRQWLKQNTNNIILSEEYYAGYWASLFELIVKRQYEKRYSYTQDILNMFARRDLPKMKKNFHMFRCIQIYPDNEHLFNKQKLVNYRITSTSLAPSYHTCPWTNQENAKRLDQLLITNSECRGLFIGFMSFLPSQDEVILGPNLEFKKIKKLKRVDKHWRSQYLENAEMNKNLCDFVEVYKIQQLQYK